MALSNPTDRENELSRIILNVCFEIHNEYGPGLFESVYEELFDYEFSKQNISLERQKAIPFIHQTIKLNAGFRADFLIENKVLLEIKSVDAFADIHFKQVLTYLKLSNCRLGLLVNFNTAHLRDGIKRIIHTPQPTP